MSKHCFRLPTIVLLALATTVPAAETAAWPDLPEKNANALVPAQSWSFAPGPRTVKVYVYYPGGELKNVGKQTGLMLDLHNWGGTHHSGTADPRQLADRYNVVAICVDYLQSGKWAETPGPYDFGYLQALDALRALYFVYDGLERLEKPFAHGRIFSTGGSGGGNVTLMVNKLAPRTFTCIIDMCGMARLSDDMAFGLPDGSGLNAGYSRDPTSPRYLTKHEQELRFVGNPVHLATMKRLGNTCQVIVVHGTTDGSCPIADAQQMVANMQAARFSVEPYFLTPPDIDGKVFKSTGHPLGNRTLIVFHTADKYLSPEGRMALRRRRPCDFACRDEKVQYRTSNGRFVISYKAGYPVARFETK